MTHPEAASRAVRSRGKGRDQRRMPPPCRSSPPGACDGPAMPLGWMARRVVRTAGPPPAGLADRQGGPCDALTLRPPVEPVLAQTAETVPGPAAVRAGAAYEQKLDGHRAVRFTASGQGGTVLVRTRRRALVPDRWQDLVAAAEARLPQSPVLDGEPPPPHVAGHHRHRRSVPHVRQRRRRRDDTWQNRVPSRTGASATPPHSPRTRPPAPRPS